jgi:hypothetical protein
MPSIALVVQRAGLSVGLKAEPDISGITTSNHVFALVERSIIRPDIAREPRCRGSICVPGIG